MHGYDELKTLDWDEEALKIAGITSAQLSELVPTQIFSNCNPDLAQKIGIDSQTPFVIGASDGVLSNLGVNAIRKGEIAVNWDKWCYSDHHCHKQIKRKNILLCLNGKALGNWWTGKQWRNGPSLDS